jgi:hypothetical protein
VWQEVPGQLIRDYTAIGADELNCRKDDRVTIVNRRLVD